MGITKSEAKREAKQIISTSDEDGSGEIEFAEFAQIWQRKLLSVNESYIHAVFTVLDEDGNGSIDVQELAKVLDMTNDQEEVKELVKEVDTDGDGVISFSEFRAAMIEKDNFGTGGNANIGHELDMNDINKVDVGNVDID